MNRNMKIAVFATLFFGILFSFIALVSSHWINTNNRNNFVHMGLWKACGDLVCFNLVGGGYAKAFLILAFIFGLLVILMAAASLYVESQGPVGVLKVLAWSVFTIALLQLIGMIHGTVIFRIDLNYYAFSWAFVLGWIAVILCFASAIICGIDHKMEPTPEGPLASRFSFRGRAIITPQGGPQGGPQAGPQGEQPFDSKPPPYSPPQGAISPYPGQNEAVQTYQTPPMAYEPQPEYQQKPGFQP